MADFHQRGPIVTLPRLVATDAPRQERELASMAKATPVALVIPCLAAELAEQALAGMVAELKQVPYLHSLLIALDRADKQALAQARQVFRGFPYRVVILWTDAPEVRALVRDIETNVGRQLPRGKGQAVWLALGYLLAEQQVRAVALHDADVLDYQRSLLAHLVRPVLHPLLRFEFSKAYYARFSDRLHGRVTRLLVRPFLQALWDLVGRHPYLQYLSAFRYPLAGEVAFTMELARWVRFPGDWGLEVGLLFEALRHRAPRRICQVDVADRFDHKHQELSPLDPGTGLHRMAADIVQNLLRTLSAAGVIINEGSFKSLRVAYQRYAEDAVSNSFAVAVFNGLYFDRHGEEETLETFSRAVAEACVAFAEDPLGTPPLPNWERVFSALPEAGVRLTESVAALGGILSP